VLEAAELHLARGAAQKEEVDPQVVRLLVRSDGTRALGSLVEEMAIAPDAAAT
jgi:hypothetical protein